MNKKELKSALAAILREPVQTDVPMLKHTTWQIGGRADNMAYPADEEELSALLKFLTAENMPWMVIGNGSNILVGDKGIRGVVIRLGENFSFTEWREQSVTAGAGKMLPALALEAAERGLVGLEFAAGIPGSLGGAVRMNAGAYGSAIGEFVTKIEVMEYSGQKCVLEASDMTFSYRVSSLFDMDVVVCRVSLALDTGSREYSMGEMQRLLHLRGLNQPLEFPSCGSVFRNPPNDHAGRLIELANLRGLQIGGAAVSKKHGNFIINLGGARAKDVKDLIEEVQQRVYDYSGIRLEPEVRMVGEFA
ncbi:MAG: UDP-N-acetylmuramate dehydrogenase [Clostridiales bacterium]|nr:UDP-N-acetylmuramate dehydrogenase [Clostridiales bacterium]